MLAKGKDYVSEKKQKSMKLKKFLVSGLLNTTISTMERIAFAHFSTGGMKLNGLV